MFLLVTQAVCFLLYEYGFFGVQSAFIRNHWMGTLHDMTVERRHFGR